MLLYGEEYSVVQGKIVENHSHFLHIYFDFLNRAMIVPKYLIKNGTTVKIQETQAIQLPKWFLRKNKIIDHDSN